MAASKAQQALTAKRRAELLRLRMRGVNFDDPQIVALGYTSRGAATKDLIRALKAHLDDEAAEVSVYRQQENERLDALLQAAWPRATEPHPVFDKEGNIVTEEIDLRAMDTILKLMDRRAKLNGWDVPVKAEVSGPDGGPITLASGSLEEMEQLFNIARQVNDDEESDDDTEEEEEVGEGGDGEAH